MLHFHYSVLESCKQKWESWVGQSHLGICLPALPMSITAGWEDNLRYIHTMELLPATNWTTHRHADEHPNVMLRERSWAQESIFYISCTWTLENNQISSVEMELSGQAWCLVCVRLWDQSLALHQKKKRKREIRKVEQIYSVRNQSSNSFLRWRASLCCPCWTWTEAQVILPSVTPEQLGL
jgi:hypothetical protein